MALIDQKDSPLFDLHSHSLHSDGILRPQAVVSRAKENGVTTLAITDHDSISGLAEARVAAAALDMQFINGIELSCLWDGVGVHVVGLNFDTGSDVLLAAIEGQGRARVERAVMIAERLARLGIADALAGAQEIAGIGAIGRPHFAQLLVNRGLVPNTSAAFKRYLGAGKPGDVKQLWPPVARAVEWINAAGGVAVLAHPEKYKMTRSKLRRLLTEFRAAGGQAMEVVSGRQAPDVTRSMAQLAAEFGLYASCGSDFHDPAQAWQDLGRFEPLPASCEPVWTCWA
ncbi:MAG: PHP domain-containing protein [Gammaproteobacteria bacterium]|nr:PHP domain-containing protein [Gammaproteobacteria bacterium]